MSSRPTPTGGGIPLRFVRAVVAIVVMASASFVSVAEVQAVQGPGYGPCTISIPGPARFHEENGYKRVKRIIRCAVERWPVPGGASKAISVATCESGLWPWAVGGDNLGIFQHKDDYWMSRVRTYLKPRWFNDSQWERLTTKPSGAFLARANILVSIKMAHRGGWGPWACA